MLLKSEVSCDQELRPKSKISRLISPRTRRETGSGVRLTLSWIFILSIFCFATTRFICLCRASEDSTSPKSYPVIIDPGHGGTDLGAVYRGADPKSQPFYEKDAMLKLGLEIARLLKLENYPVTLTRTTDRNLSLKERSQIANKAKGKLFLSLHMNSAPTPKGLQSGGVETYILHTDSTDGSSKRLAELENQGKGPDAGISKTGHLTVDMIVKDLRLHGFHDESLRLGCLIQEELTKVTKQKHRGVKKAMFFVLLGADMPSVLVETGFVQSKRDRDLFLSIHSIRSIASSIVRTIRHFRQQNRAKSCVLL